VTPTPTLPLSTGLVDLIKNPAFHLRYFSKNAAKAAKNGLNRQALHGEGVRGRGLPQIMGTATEIHFAWAD
jgi:hypothetical protein